MPDPQQCVNYTQAQCALRLVHNYCPRLCGKCPAPDPVCPYKHCHGGYFSNTTCSCLCYPNWSGDLCDQLVCNATLQPAVCSGYTSAHCNYQEIYEYCPILCGSCNNESADSINVGAENLPGLPGTTCLNGGTPRGNDSCACKINLIITIFSLLIILNFLNRKKGFPNFSGSSCETNLCVNESASCSTLPKSLCTT